MRAQTFNTYDSVHCYRNNTEQSVPLIYGGNWISEDVGCVLAAQFLSLFNVIKAKLLSEESRSRIQSLGKQREVGGCQDIFVVTERRP